MMKNIRVTNHITFGSITYFTFPFTNTQYFSRFVIEVVEIFLCVNVFATISGNENTTNTTKSRVYAHLVCLQF